MRRRSVVQQQTEGMQSCGADERSNEVNKSERCGCNVATRVNTLNSRVNFHCLYKHEVCEQIVAILPVNTYLLTYTRATALTTVVRE